MGDDDEAAVTIATRIVRSGLIEKLAPLLVAAFIGSSASVATRKVEDAGQDAIVQSNRTEILAIKADLEMFRSGFLQRVDVEEKEREEMIRKLEHRLTWLEARLNISAPPAAAEVAPR